MSAITNLFPKNPIDAGKAEQIKKITAKVLERFIKNYGSAIKEVCLEEAEEKYGGGENDEKKEKFYNPWEDPTPKPSRRIGEGKKPHRPRPAPGEYKPEKPNPEKVTCNVTNWETLDSDVDPYVSYIIVSSYKGYESQKSRRYKEFKELHKKLGKLVPAKAVLPEASSKWGSRNLSYDFIEGRRKTLNEYLKELCEAPGVSENQDFIKFLGLIPPKDPQGEEMFTRAVAKTKWDFWIWKKIMWDTHDEAIAKIIIEQIKRDMWYDIVHACPPVERARRAALKLAYTAIKAIVSPAVAAAWPPAEKAAEPARAKIVELVGKILGEIVKKKVEIKGRLKEGMGAALNPVVAQISPVIGQVIGAVVPPVFQALGATKEKLTPIDDEIVSVFTATEEDKGRAAFERLANIKKEIAGKIAEGVVSSVKGAADNITSGINLEPAKKALQAPLTEGIAALIDSVTGIVEPRYWTEVVRHMWNYKEEIAKEDPGSDESKRERVNYRLNWEEYDIRWWSNWWGWDVRYEGRRLAWNISSLPGCGPISDVFWDLAVDVQRYLHRAPLHKFSWTFGDWLWGFMEDANDTRPWRTKVDAAFILGYRAALKEFRKKIGKILFKYGSDFIKRPILGPIEQHVLPLIQDITAPLDAAIPEALKDVIDINGLVSSAIMESVSEACDRVLLEQKPIVIEELDKVFPGSSASFIFPPKAKKAIQAAPTSDGASTSAAAEPTPTPAAAEPTPAVAEPTPAAAEPAPATVEPTPAAAEPAPATVEPTPAAAEPTPAAEPAPEATPAAEPAAQ